MKASSLSAALCALAITSSGTAQAYGFMLRHDYTSCAQCHVDPSGGSVLTAYGRAQGELILRTRYGVAADEPGKVAGFLFGLFELPEEVLLGGDVRVAVLGGSSLTKPRAFPMQADVVAAVKSGKLTFSGSLGLGSAATTPAKLVGDRVQLISRHHWVGYAPDEDQSFMLRLGRMPLPFGVRLPEHTAWARASTRTDTNTSQQHGVSLAYSGERVRGELMGVVGNLQLSPLEYRERGYSGFLELTPNTWATFGVSSLVTHAQRDLQDPERAVFRHAHGIFGRLAPWRPLVLSLEADVTHVSRSGLGGDLGGVGLLHADLELTQGLHLVALGEVSVPSFRQVSSGVGVGGWAGAWWFFAPHADVRVDFITRREPDGALHYSLLGQLHFYL
ncbi:MAG: hypothetical protein Q8N23_27510 [Archangium sp.]|nr:hypothetical protein [Archangium sp.]MDP3156455.1 hypothetical protein [Archangium sp.]MDP3573099.1 hypothetical protein [Archangium sp.]